MLQRDSKSYKGQNGRVAVIGGSHRFHGAPIFAALAAEASGVDLIFPLVHACHEIVTRQASLNFIVQTFRGDSLTPENGQRTLELLSTVDCAVIGPGLAATAKNEEILRTLVGAAPCPLILDATALSPAILHSIRGGSTAVLTPHRGELSTLIGRDLAQLSPKDLTALVRLLAEEHGVTVLLKGPEDIIVAPDGTMKTVNGGNAGLTKGGTGDALAGLIAGLIAQKIPPFDACVMGATIIKKVGEELFKTRGYAYTTKEVIHLVPRVLHRSRGS